MDAPTAQPSRDDSLAVLSNGQRRKLLDSLRADSSPDEAEPPGITVEPDIRMYHIHLPKLAEYGLINWDRETNRVTKGPNFEAAEAILAFLETNDGVLPPREVGV